MMTFLKNKEKSNMVVATLGSLALGAAIFFQQYHLDKLSSARTLSSGVETCFSRVTQSFTALMLKEIKSNFLQSEFMTSTSSCWEEVSKVYQKNFDNKVAFSAVNQLISDTHWFHEKLSKISAMIETQQVSLGDSNILSKYANLDDLKTSLLESMELLAKKAKKTADTWLVAFISFFIGMSSWVLMNLLNSRQNSISRETLNKKITQLNLDEVQARELEDLLQKALQLSQIHEASKIFDIYKSVLIERTQQSVIATHQAQLDVGNVRNQSIDKSIPKENDSNLKEVVSLTESVQRVINSQEDDAFKAGVSIENKLPNLWIKGENEDIEQLIYSTLNTCISLSKQHNSGRQITINGKMLGATTYISFKVNNVTINQSCLDNLVNDVFDESYAQISMVNELAKGVVSSVEFSNKGSHSFMIRFLFEAFVDKEEEKAPSLVQVIKGKKKEILDRLKQASH